MQAPLCNIEDNHTANAMTESNTTLHISMPEVARTCTFGPIRVGQTRADVPRLLGEPSNYWARVQGQAHAGVWCYGLIDVAFGTADEVGLIVATTQPLTDGGPTIRIDPWLVVFGTPIKRFEAGLRDEGIPFQRLRPKHTDKEQHVVTDAGTVFVFEPKGDTFTLCRWWAGDAPAFDVYWPT